MQTEEGDGRQYMKVGGFGFIRFGDMSIESRRYEDNVWSINSIYKLGEMYHFSVGNDQPYV